jgi:hypothetical protein
MLKSEFYAWCIGIAGASLCWLLFGWGGTFCFGAGMIIGDINVAWVDDIFKQKRPPE